MCEETFAKEKWQLLQCLRTTVEGLLTNGVSNVWNVYGGLNRLHNIMQRIFKHGYRVFDPTGEPDCWIFIEGLNWLQPSLATSPVIHENEDYLANLPTQISTRKDALWLYKSLENHTLSQKLSWLLSDKEHLLSCLEPWAFLCQENLAEATLICLRAVEKNQPALLTEIDLNLFLPNWAFENHSPKRTHRRSSSYPINLHITRKSLCNNRDSVDSANLSQRYSDSSTFANSSVIISSEANLTKSVIAEEASNNVQLKPWTSFPALDKNRVAQECGSHSRTRSEARLRRNTVLSDVIKVDYLEGRSSGDKNVKSRSFFRKGRNKSKTGTIGKTKVNEDSSGSSDTLTCEDSVRSPSKKLNQSSEKKTSMKMNTPQKNRRRTSVLPGSAPEFSGSWSAEVEGQKCPQTSKKSFMEDGGSSVQPMATGYFPRPREGQSLTSFLSSTLFTRTNAELDRENAHFSISEAVIAAIEQVKCNRQLRLAEEVVDESDEEINNLKQRIRLRRRQRQEEKRKGGVWSRDLLSDGKTDTTTTDQSVSPLSTSPGTTSDSILTDDVEDLEIDESSNLFKLRNSGMSMSMASLYSKADLCRSSPRHSCESALTDSTISAEGVALSLISRFSEKHLPRASELKWLVSEQDAPQQLLPLPKSWPISPDETEIDKETNTIPLRGTVEWAPPRPQIIFTPHPTPVQKILIAKQNYRCAGCGMKVAVKYAHRFRYCEYLGRYFCTGCHTNQLALIPGKILSKWDFNKYSVSNFSYRLLDQMFTDPLFQISDLNSSLYRRIKQLDRTRGLRTQLFYLKDFLFACRFAISFQDLLKKEPDHLINDPHVYSIQDLTLVKSGALPAELHKLIQECCIHVKECVLCQARGFVCELCFSKDVIFPWELGTVARCDNCGACYHIQCKGSSSKTECRKCIRIQARRESREEPL